MIHFVYLISIIPFAILWVIFFYFRKDLRKQMVQMSLFLGVVSVATAYFWWTKDWWTPVTLTRGVVGVEDFILGFFSGGVMVSLYEFIFRKRIKSLGEQDNHLGIIVLLSVALVTSVLFWGLGISSFWSSSVALIFGMLLIFSSRKDLLICGVYSGLFLVVVSLFSYAIMSVVSPEFVTHTWPFQLSGLRVARIPIEEFIFWFLAGMFWGPFYEYWHSKKLIKNSL